jgi:DNA (cytosine-5)-methyltransferase 1
VTAYCNEIDGQAAQWLRNLIYAGHIAPGVVDERSIEDVYPSDLKGFSQCHFFAGIGVWSYALRSAGWSDDRPVWTGSCPCQPFSGAGKGAGFTDERHLWPAFHHLISQCRPAAVIGEQVASKDANPWIDLVQDDMEALGYAFGAIPFPAASVGAPNIRDRLYWVAHAYDTRPQRRKGVQQSADQCTTGPHDVVSGLDNTVCDGWGAWRDDDAKHDGQQLDAAGDLGQRPGPTNGHWRAADWLLCRDGKWRPVEPGTFPLVDGTPARVVRLRAYGNAINAQAAQAFIECVMEAA